MDKESLENLKYILRDIHTKINSFYRSRPYDKYLRKSLKEIEQAFSILDIIEKELKNPNREIISSLVKKAQLLRDSLSYLSRTSSELYKQVHRFMIYLRASRYDLTDMLREVRKCYRMYITAFVITLVLIPVFLSASVLFIGIMLFPLLISIHAFRARKKLGPLIASALIPIILFVCTNAVWYSIYAISTSEELSEIAHAVGSEYMALAIVIAIGLAGTIGLILGVYSYAKLMKYIDAFV